MTIDQKTNSEPQETLNALLDMTQVYPPQKQQAYERRIRALTDTQRTKVLQDVVERIKNYPIYEPLARHLHDKTLATLTEPEKLEEQLSTEKSNKKSSQKKAWAGYAYGLLSLFAPYTIGLAKDYDFDTILASTAMTGSICGTIGFFMASVYYKIRNEHKRRISKIEQRIRELTENK